MASILVKAYVRQLFGSPDIHMLEFDSQETGVEDLRKAISNLVDGRTVALTWLDRDGDEIRLSTDEQLKFAVAHGVKDNVLRVSVRVDWLGVERQQRRRCENRNAADEATARAAAEGESEEMNAAGDGEGSPDATDDDEGSPDTAAAASVGVGTAEELAEEGEDVRTTGKPVAKGKRGRKCRRGQCPGNSTHYSGFVRTGGPDGLSKERELSEEEAAYLLNRSNTSYDVGHCSPFSLAGSLFGRPQLQYRRPVHTPALFLSW